MASLPTSPNPGACFGLIPQENCQLAIGCVNAAQGVTAAYPIIVGYCNMVGREAVWGENWTLKVFRSAQPAVPDDYPINAFKHAYTMARVVHYGAPLLAGFGNDMNNSRRVATTLGNTIESISWPKCVADPAKSVTYCQRARAMDQYNNRVGRKIGARLPGSCAGSPLSASIA